MIDHVQLKVQQLFYDLQLNQNIKDGIEKNYPSNRIRTSDLRIAALFPLQSSALPTELSRDSCWREDKTKLYNSILNFISLLSLTEHLATLSRLIHTFEVYHLCPWKYSRLWLEFHMTSEFYFKTCTLFLKILTVKGKHSVLIEIIRI